MSVKAALFGLPKSEDQAASIVNLLKGAGFSDNDIRFYFPTGRETDASLMKNIPDCLRARRGQ
jgi:hypothetical protein